MKDLPRTGAKLDMGSTDTPLGYVTLGLSAIVFLVAAPLFVPLWLVGKLVAYLCPRCKDAFV